VNDVTLPSAGSIAATPLPSVGLRAFVGPASREHRGGHGGKQEEAAADE
jgi:hypothetical protein